jgi:Rrf2 family protein
MRISKKTEYALHSVLYISVHDGRNILLDELAQQGVSREYLAKVMRKLAKAGILRSSVGVRGGYELGRSPEKISLADIFNAVEDTDFFTCEYEARKCDAFGVCSMIQPFNDAYNRFLDELKKTSLKDMTDRANCAPFDLEWLKRGSF